MGRPKQTASTVRDKCPRGRFNNNNNDGTGINKNKIRISRNIQERGD